MTAPRFIDRVTPPLGPGDYTVTVTQTVTAAGVAEGYQATQRFSVAGAHASLPAGAVASVFPPPASQGDFANALPHVALSEPSLPWQRTPGGPPPSPATLLGSWLAVLVFDAGDPPPAPRTITLAELASGSRVYSAPYTRETGEQPTDPVTVIDVPVDLFAAIAPAAADLPWLAHVRSVDVAAKATDRDSAAPTDYAVVLANRLPAPGTVSTAHLVSLEGLGDRLPGGTASLSGYDAVRLISLVSWSFGTEQLTETFSDALAALSLGPLQRPFDADAGAGSSAARAAVQTAFGLGYVPFDHTLRNGDATVSWYRGPLLPRTSAASLQPPFADPDQLTRLDPGSGMFDVSYSAAWTLGRLLALRDNGFATALYRWKLSQTADAVAALEQERLDGLVPETDPGDDQVKRAVKALLAPALEALGGDG